MMNPLAIRRARTALFLAVVTLSLPQVSSAAFCSLRDPVAALQRLFPESERHRSIVRPVGREQRDAVGSRLPFSLHFNELGQHTLYVALHGQEPLGVIHARSEASKWGLMEVAWALNLDMTIHGFYLQRCRSPRCSDAAIAELQSELTGKPFEKVREMLDSSGEKLGTIARLQFSEQQDVVIPIIRSALKTIAVTESTWKEDLIELRALKMAHAHFPELNDLTLRSTPPQADNDPIIPEQGSMVLADTVRVRTLYSQGSEVARFVDAEWSHSPHTGRFFWLFSMQGEVLGVQPAQRWETPEISSAFTKLHGQHFSSDMECASSAELAGKFLFLKAFGDSEAK